MNEDFLQYVWLFQQFDGSNLKTIKNEPIIVLNSGLKNTDAGPDFSNAKVKIGNTIWVGNIEIHLQSSDWEKHQHSNNDAYKNVILHIVFQHDKEISFLVERNIPTLELKPYISQNTLNRYFDIIHRKEQFIPCETLFHSVDSFKKESFLNQLVIERLIEKSNPILEQSNKNQDWESILFQQLSIGFGLKVNSDAMLFWAKSFDSKLIQQYTNNQNQLDALFFGQAGFLEDSLNDSYYNELKSEYDFLRKKHRLEPINNALFKFLRLRPSNFPTIRIAQLSSLYYKTPKLFSRLISINKIEDFYSMVDSIKTNPFWDNHYTFQKESNKSSIKKLTKDRIDLIIINCILPIKFAYYKTIGKENNDEIFSIYSKIKAEKNTIINQFKGLGSEINSALNSQAHLQLYKAYCKSKKCLNCRIGHQILSYDGKA